MSDKKYVCDLNGCVHCGKDHKDLPAAPWSPLFGGLWVSFCPDRSPAWLGVVLVPADRVRETPTEKPAVKEPEKPKAPAEPGKARVREAFVFVSRGALPELLGSLPDGSKIVGAMVPQSGSADIELRVEHPDLPESDPAKLPEARPQVARVFRGWGLVK